MILMWNRGQISGILSNLKLESNKNILGVMNQVEDDNSSFSLAASELKYKLASLCYKL